MRKVLISAQNVMVAVGGQRHTQDGFIPGVGEEMQLAFNHNLPRFLVAGLGGFAQHLAHSLTPDTFALGQDYMGGSEIGDKFAYLGKTLSGGAT